MNLKEIVKESYSNAEVARKLGYSQNRINGQITNKVKKLITEAYLDNSHFTKNGSSGSKYKKAIKICPVCKNEFSTLKDSKDEKYTCSYGCSNTYFRSGPKNGNWKEEAYRTTCFHYHKKECVICKEKNIVEAHHLDEDSKNHSPENLIPLCPTHHQYWHSRFKSLVENKVLEYIKMWTEDSQLSQELGVASSSLARVRWGL